MTFLPIRDVNVFNNTPTTPSSGTASVSQFFNDSFITTFITAIFPVTFGNTVIIETSVEDEFIPVTSSFTSSQSTVTTPAPSRQAAGFNPISATSTTPPPTSFTSTPTSITPPPTGLTHTLTPAPTPTSNGSPPTNATLVAALSGSLGAVLAILVIMCVIWYLRRKRSRGTEVTSTAFPGGTSRCPALFGGEGRLASGLFGGKMSAPISAISEDVLNHEHDVQQSGSMIRRVSWDVEDGRQAESDISEKTSPMSRHASSTMAAYGGPHSDPPSSSSIFGCSAAMPSEVAFSGPPISGRRPRQEEDGGVRIAGGRPGDGETSSLHTLPPPYNDYL